jgi:hypothetical protein
MSGSNADAARGHETLCPQACARCAHRSRRTAARRRLRKGRMQRDPAVNQPIGNRCPALPCPALPCPRLLLKGSRAASTHRGKYSCVGQAARHSVIRSNACSVRFFHQCVRTQTSTSFEQVIRNNLASLGRPTPCVVSNHDIRSKRGSTSEASRPPGTGQSNLPRRVALCHHRFQRFAFRHEHCRALWHLLLVIGSCHRDRGVVRNHTVSPAIHMAGESPAEA